MDSFLEELNSPPPKDPRSKCATKDWLETLSPEHRQALEDTLQDRKWMTSKLFQFVRKHGYTKQYNSFRQHRNGECSCGR